MQPTTRLYATTKAGSSHRSRIATLGCCKRGRAWLGGVSLIRARRQARLRIALSREPGRTAGLLRGGHAMMRQLITELHHAGAELK